MEGYLNMLDAPWPNQEENFDEEKIKFISTKLSIWDYYGIPQSTYLAYTNEEKSKMFKEYYKKLVDKYHDIGKIICLLRLIFLAGCLLVLLLFGQIFLFLGLFLPNLNAPTQWHFTSR